MIPNLKKDMHFELLFDNNFNIKVVSLSKILEHISLALSDVPIGQYVYMSIRQIPSSGEKENE